MKDDLKGRFFRELAVSDSFQAQLALEDETYTSLLKSLLAIDLSKGTNPALEYARLRGSLEVLTTLKRTRELLIEASRSRDKLNS